MDCTESTCDSVKYETFAVRVVTSFVKITLDEKCTDGGIGGFREIRALSRMHDGKDTLVRENAAALYDLGNLCTILKSDK